MIVHELIQNDEDWLVLPLLAAYPHLLFEKDEFNRIPRIVAHDQQKYRLAMDIRRKEEEYLTAQCLLVGE